MKKKTAIITVLFAVMLGGCVSEKEAESFHPSATPEMVKETLTLSGDEETVIAEEKTEEVYAYADPSGKVYRITVDANLKGVPSGGYIRDRSCLREILNINGEEQYYTYGEDIAWDNHGETISYRGESVEELPVEVRITYYLDGREITAGELAGKSGHVKISFDYINHAERQKPIRGKTETVHVPFLVMTLIAAGEDLKNITVTNGRVLQVGGQNLILCYALPGMAEDMRLGQYEVTEDIEIPDHAEVEADTENFALSFTATIVSDDLFEEIKEDDLKDLDDLGSDMEKLQDAADELVSGTGELYDGLKTYGDYQKEYQQGVFEICRGSDALREGMETLNTYGKELKKGASSISSALSEINTLLESIDLSAISEDMDTEAFTNALTALMQDLQVLSEASADIQSMASSAAEMIAGLEAYKGTVNAAASLIREEALALDPSALLNAIKINISTAVEDREDLDDAQKESLKEDLVQAVDSTDTETCRTHIETITTTLDSLPQPEIPEMDMDLSGVTAAAEDMSVQLAVISAFLQETSSAMSGLEELKAGLASLKEGISQLSTGSKSLSDGMKEYMEGISAAYEGTKALNDGIGALWEAGNAMSEGYDEILDGVLSLKDGVKKFNDEGIREITRMGGEDLQQLLARVRALRTADLDYDTYSGKTDGTKGSVRFIIETDEIKK